MELKFGSCPSLLAMSIFNREVGPKNIWVFSSCDQSEAFIDPAGDASKHFLDRPAHLREAYGSLVCPIAMRTCTVDDEDRPHRILLHGPFCDGKHGKIDRP